MVKLENIIWRKKIYGTIIKKNGPVTVSRPCLYARTLLERNLDETEVAWGKTGIFLFFFVTFFT